MGTPEASSSAPRQNRRGRLGSGSAIVSERRKATAVRQPRKLEEEGDDYIVEDIDDDDNYDEDYDFNDDEVVEEALEIVEDIVGMFNGDNTTVEDVVEDVEEILGVDVLSSESATETPEDTATAGTTAATTYSPTAAPRSASTQPTEAFDQGAGETEDDDDDIFKEDFYQKNRPGIPNSTPTSFAIFAALVGVFAMIFTAWQMSDNPDGLFASLCRLIITSIQLILRVVCSPCRKCLPCCFSSSGGGYHEPYGHMPVSTMDYGYKDPALELS